MSEMIDILSAALAAKNREIEALREDRARLRRELWDSCNTDPAISPDVKWIVDKEMVSLRLIDEEDARADPAEAMRAKCEAMARDYYAKHGYGAECALDIAELIAALKGNGERK